MKKYVYYIVAVILLNANCTKDWLVPEPLSFFAPQNILTNKEGMMSALTSCDRLLREEFVAQHAPILTSMIFSEQCVLGTTDIAGPSQDLIVKILPDADNNNDQTNRIFWYWINDNLGIRYANTVISRIDDATYSSEAERNEILGMAYWHRAFRYYRLCMLFGDIPIILSEIYSPVLNLCSVEREVILRKMKEDMQFAVQYVSDDNHRGMVSKGACYHLLAKISLTLGDFDDAINAANAVINGGRHSLMTTRFGVDVEDPSKNLLWDLHRPLNKNHQNNTEVLYATLDRYENRTSWSGTASLTMRNFVPFWANTTNRIQTPTGEQGMTDARTGQGVAAGVADYLDYNGIYGRGIGRCRLTWYSSNNVWDDANDLRHAPGNWMRITDLTYNHPSLRSTPWYQQPIRLWDDEGKLLCLDTLRNWGEWAHYKLYIEDPANATAAQYNGGYADFYIMRLAETHLLRAEAYLWKGDKASAAVDINLIRQRAGAANIDANDVTIETLLDERTRELLYEENRKIELTRVAILYAKTGLQNPYGKTYTLANLSKDNYFYDRIMDKGNFYNKNVLNPNGQTYTMAPHHIWWPIQQTEIDGNTMGRINQNEGYTGFELNITPLKEIPESGISTME